MTDKKVWFIVGADSIGVTEQKVADLREQIDAFRNLLTCLAFDDPQPTGNRR